MISKTNDRYLRYFHQKKSKLKTKILILFFFLYNLTSTSQNLQLKIIGKSTIETKIIDSIGYSTNRQNAKQIEEEINIVSTKLTRNGYINNQILEKKKEKDSSYTVKFSLEKKIENIHIYIGIKNHSLPVKLFETNQESIILT